MELSFFLDRDFWKNGKRIIDGTPLTFFGERGLCAQQGNVEASLAVL